MPDARAVVCPYCGAEVDEPCRVKGKRGPGYGRLLERPHFDRQQLAQGLRPRHWWEDDTGEPEANEPPGYAQPDMWEEN